MTRIIIGTGVAAGVLAMVFVFGRQPIGRFLYERKFAEGQMALRAYLDGRMPLDSAATRYNKALDEALPYLALMDASIGWEEGESWAIIGAPTGDAVDDPKVAVFYDRAQYLRLGPKRYKEIKDWMQARLDSLTQGEPGRRAH